MKVLLVDGYNVIRSSDLYRDIEVEDFTGGEGLNPAREALIADVAMLAQGEYRATVVFDAGGNAESRGEPRSVAGIEVIYSPAGKSADSVIETLATQARERGDDVFVVTSDAQTQWTVLGDHVTRLSSSSFAQEVERANETVQERNPAPSEKHTLAERIDPKVAEKLSRMARGE
jgi:predicted RNA-binding protein with PIN domain